MLSSGADGVPLRRKRWQGGKRMSVRPEKDNYRGSIGMLIALREINGI